MTVEVEGPLRGHYLCKLPPNTTVEVDSDAFSIVKQPLGKESNKFRTSEKEERVFIRAKGEGKPGEKLSLIINEKEEIIQTDLSKAVLHRLHEIYEKVLAMSKVPEEEGLEASKEETFVQKRKGSQSKGKKIGPSSAASEEDEKDPAEEIVEMISEAEDLLLKTGKERLTRLSEVSELPAMEVRQVKPSSKSDAGLLRRYKREHGTGHQKQLHEQCQAMHKSLVEEEETTSSSKECRISLQTSLEETNDILEDKETLQKLSNLDWMPWETLFGLVGIPVSHTVQNFTDPMNIGINENLKAVVPSNQFALNQKSLWSLSGSKGIRSLDDIAREWGFNNKVTAVVPIKSWNHPAVWKAFHNGPLSRMVTSCQLRGAHIPMQQDEQALTAATLLRTIKDWPTPNEGQASLMADLLDTIQFTDPRSVGVPAQITEFMKHTEMHIIDNMPSALAPMAKMMESKFVLSFAGTEESNEFWKAIVSNSIYWKVRRLVAGKNRDDILRTLANFKERTINMEELSLFNEDLTVYARTFKIAQKFSKQEEVNKSLFQDNHENIEEFKKFITDMNYDLFLLTEVVKAIICCGRVTKKLKCPEFFTEEKAWQWMEEEHNKRELRSSGEIESTEAWEEFLNAAPNQQLGDFASHLNEVIPNEFEKIRTSSGKKSHKFKIEEIFTQLRLPTGVQTKEKLKLILFGKVSGGTKWGNGESLKNGLVAKKILEVLEPLLNDDEDNAVDVKKHKEMIDKTNQYTKHWYRQKGSRMKYTNDRPSFWAITKHSTPWAFLIKDREGYASFKVDLRELGKEDEDVAKRNFYQDWKHLLKKDPTKELPLATAKPPRETRKQTDLGSESTSRKDSGPGVDDRVTWENRDQMLSIFPHPSDNTFGLKGLMETYGISPKDLDLDQEKIPEAAAKIASNWETVLLGMLPRDKAEKTIHSLREVFRIDENSFKAFNAYQVLGRTTDFVERKANLIEVLLKAKEKANEDSITALHSEDKSSDIDIPDAQIKVFERSSIRILERLLPLRAVELKQAIKELFGNDQARMMSATYHILRRYADYGLASLDALMKLLMNEELIYSTEDILVGSEQFDLVHPAVSYELKFDVEGAKTEVDIKKGLQKTLDDFLTSENALLWMNQEYERSRSNYNWKSLEVTREDLDSVSISVDEAWYGGGIHEMVTVEFKYEKYNSSREIEKKQKQRLCQLKDFFQLVLENVHQLVPITEEFTKRGRTWSSSRAPDGEDKNYETFEYKRARQLFHTLRRSATARQETVSIFKSLGEKGAKYSEAQNILDLLDSNDDVDNLTIRVQKAKRLQVNQVTCSPIFICPEKETRLKELPEILLNKINELMKKELVTGAWKNRYEEVFDTLVNLNYPALFPNDKRPEISSQIVPNKLTPQSMIAIFIKHLRQEDCTLGDLGDAFLAVGKALSSSHAKAMASLKEGLDAIVREARQLSEDEAEKQFAKDRSLGTFVQFLKDHHPNGVKKYAKARGLKKEQFLQLANDNHLKVGDMICFWRKNYTVGYAHAGIYTPVPGKNSVVHVQGEDGWLRSMRGFAEVSIGDLETIAAKDDLVFFIRECKTPSAQAEVLSKVEACLFEEPIKYSYNGHYGSCQTFCSKVLGSSLFEELNPESFLTTQTGLKWMAGWYLGGESTAEELVTEMDKRFQSLPSFDLDHEEDLITTCPSDCRLTIQSYIRETSSSSFYAPLDPET